MEGEGGGEEAGGGSFDAWQGKVAASNWAGNFHEMPTLFPRGRPSVLELIERFETSITKPPPSNQRAFSTRGLKKPLSPPDQLNNPSLSLSLSSSLVSSND